MKIGSIGRGIMGRPMATNPLRGGHVLHLHGRDDAPDELLRAGGPACGSGRELAERAEVVVAMVPDTPHVEAVPFGEGGVAEDLSPGKTVVDTSSIAPVARLSLEAARVMTCVSAPITNQRLFRNGCGMRA